MIVICFKKNIYQQHTLLLCTVGLLLNFKRSLVVLESDYLFPESQLQYGLNLNI